MILMNEGINCPSEPPKIEGGNEEDQRNIMEEGNHVNVVQMDDGQQF